MAARHRLRLNTRLIVTRYLVITGVGFLLLELTAVSKVNRLPFPSWIVQSAYRDLRYPPVVLFHLSSLPTYLPVVDNELHLVSPLPRKGGGLCIKLQFLLLLPSTTTCPRYDFYLLSIGDGNLVRQQFIKRQIYGTRKNILEFSFSVLPFAPSFHPSLYPSRNITETWFASPTSFIFRKVSRIFEDEDYYNDTEKVELPDQTCLSRPREKFSFESLHRSAPLALFSFSTAIFNRHTVILPK